MTGADFLAAGLVVERQPDNAYRIRGPAGRADLLEELRFEVLTRVELVGDDARLPRGKYYRESRRCDLCGDPIEQDGGLCVLCVLARHKAIAARRDRERRERGELL